MARLAVISAAITTGLGIAVGLTVLLLPSQVKCSLPALEPGVGRTAVGNCVPVAILESADSIWPLPLLPILVWSLAPTLALFGVVWLVRGRRGMPLVGLALVLEATAIISFVVGPMFLIYVFVPLLVTALLAWTLTRSLRRTQT